MKKQRWLIAMTIILVLVVAGTGCDRIRALWGDDKEHYVNKDLGVRFKVPKGWTADTSRKQEDAKSKLLAMYSKSGSETGITVHYMEADLKKLPLPAVARFQSGLFGMLGFTPSGEPREVTINGRRAVEIVMSGGFGDMRKIFAESLQDTGNKNQALQPSAAMKMAFVSYYVTDEAKNRLYLLTFFSMVDRYDAFVRDFMELVNSFEIT